MSHGSEGSRGQTRHRYLKWMSKGPKSKEEMSAYMQGAGKLGVETTSSQRGGSKPIQQSRQFPIDQTETGYRVIKPTRRIPMEDIAEKKELVKEKGVVEKAHKDDEWPEMPMMQMPRITNLRRERG